MAARKSKKPADDVMDAFGADEDANAKKVAGTNEADYLQTKTVVGDIEEKSSKLNGEKSQALKRYEKAGGNKQVFTTARMIMKMEDGTKRDFIRQLFALLEYEGVFNQQDMFENLNGMARTFAGPEVVTTEQARGTEPQSIGAGQADAVLQAMAH